MPKTRIAVISDSHGLHDHFTKQIRAIDADILIHAGDFTSGGYHQEAVQFLNWFSSFTHIKHKVFIAGNHDRCCQESPDDFRELLKRYPELTYLCHESVTIDNLNIFGSPWTPAFYDWSFMYRRGEPARALWEQIPEDTDILITHGPPNGILDNVNGESVGCYDLLRRIDDGLEHLKYVCYGHIHPGFGHIHPDQIPL